MQAPPNPCKDLALASSGKVVESLAALGFLLLISTLVIVALATALLGRDFMLRRERQ